MRAPGRVRSPGPGLNSERTKVAIRPKAEAIAETTERTVAAAASGCAMTK